MINLSKIKEVAFGLLKNTEGYKARYFLNKITPDEPRIKVLRGFRGVGKTTALLQLMNEKAIYFSMDHPAVTEHSLYEVSEAFVKSGYTLLLIDEVHYYKEWKRDTKAIYDEFSNVSIVLSGSAPLALEPERRYELLEANPLSLREFAYLSGREIPSNESWRTQDETIRFLAKENWLYEAYNVYMNGGAFPAYFSYKEKILPAIYNSIRKSIREDAVFFARVDGEMVSGMERLLVFLASASLGEFSINSLSSTLGLTKHKTYEIVGLMESMKILRLIRPAGQGAKMVRGDPKLMFSHPLLRKAICHTLGVEANLGALREELAVFSLLNRGWSVRTIKGRKHNPDYIIEKGKEKIVIEIGGPSKSRKQLRGIAGQTMVLDDKQLICLAFF